MKINGWIDRKGKFYECGWSCHYPKIVEILDPTCDCKIDPDRIEEYAFAIGFIKVRNDNYSKDVYGVDNVLGDKDFKISQAQLNKLFELFKYDKKIINLLNNFPDENIL